MRISMPVLLLLLIAATPVLSFAQKTIHGRVTDSVSGGGLPSAHVAIIGQRAGTITSDEGKYQLELPAVPVKVRFSSIGYHSKEFEITSDTPDSLDVPLAENPVVLDEIVVTDEDPAVRIMREVIRRKQIWRAGLEKYTAAGYERVTLGNGKRNVMKLESILDVSWDKVRGFTARPKAKRQTGVKQNDSVALSNINLYDDYITILDQRILGVTHPGALDAYTFTVIGQRKIDDKTVYDLSVAPKNRYEKLLAGRISVLDGEYAMIEAKLRPTAAIKMPMGRSEMAALRKAFLPPPKLDMEISLEQQFDTFGGDCWLPIGDKFEGKFDFGWHKVFAFPPIHWEETTRFTDFTLTAASLADKTPPAPAPKRQTAGVHFEAKRGEISIGISAGEELDSPTAETDATAQKSTADADSTQINNSDFIPPTVMIYTANDSTTVDITKELPKESGLALLETFRPTGIIGNYIAKEAEKEIKKEQERSKQTNTAGQQKDKSGKLEKRGSHGVLDWSMLPYWSYNRVDGQNPGLKLKTTMKKRYTAEVLGMYQTERKRVAYDGRLVFPMGKQPNGTIELRASDATSAFFDSPVYSRFVNSILTMAGNDDYFDYYRSISQSARIKYAFPKHRFEISGAVTREKHLPLEKSTNYNILGRDTTQRENPAIEKGRLGSVTLSFGYGDESVPYLLGDQRRIEFSFEYADPGLFSSDFSFRKYRMTADWRFPTFFRNGMEPNTLDVRFIGMVSDGDLPVQRFGYIDSRLAPLTPYGTFRSLRSPLAGEQLCALFWEHNFKTVPFEVLRLKFLARRGTECILQGASGRTWISDERMKGLANTSGYLDRFHNEIGLSVNNIYAGMRVDVTKDLGSDTVTWGIGLKRPF